MFTSSFMFNYLHNIDDIFIGDTLAASKIDQVDLIILPSDKPVSVSARSKP
jgi:hypothetical protein